MLHAILQDTKQRSLPSLSMLYVCVSSHRTEVLHKCRLPQPFSFPSSLRFLSSSPIAIQSRVESTKLPSGFLYSHVYVSFSLEQPVTRPEVQFCAIITPFERAISPFYSVCPAFLYGMHLVVLPLSLEETLESL
jgi:hypothetical protein